MAKIQNSKHDEIPIGMVISTRDVLVIWYSNFDIVSDFDIRISDFNPILAEANPFELHRLASPLTLACDECWDFIL
jgi:hypothetical protein